MPVRTSWFQFFGELKDHLPRELRNVEVRKDFLLPGSAKDVIESLGVPHTEVDAVTVNGESVDWSRLIVDGDRVSVYPVGYATGLQPVLHLMPEIAGEPRFVADVHLGRLAGYLRMLGFDTAYSNSATDPELVSIAVEEQRVLLTRDRELLKHGSLERGYWLRETAPRRQVEEVVRRFRLAERIRPLTRCIVCNGLLRSRAKGEVGEKVPPRVLEWCKDFRQCEVCGRVYWEGSHAEKMRTWVRELKG